MGLFNKIKKILGRIWNSIKKIFRKIVDWTNDILNFFRKREAKKEKEEKEKERLNEIIGGILASGECNECDAGLTNKHEIHLSIKDGNSISNVVYDDKKGEVICIESENIEFNSLDSQTADAFKKYPMAVFEH